MSYALVAALLDLGKTASTIAFLGVYKRNDDTTMLTIHSSQSLIAFLQSNAVAKGGRYTPPAEMHAWFFRLLD